MTFPRRVIRINFCLIAASVGITLLLLSGCDIQRKRHVESLIEASVPNGLTMEKLNSRYLVKSQPDGSLLAEVPVYYRVTADRYSAERLLSTPTGRRLALEIDALTRWVEAETPVDDPVRAAIRKRRSDIPEHVVILKPEMNVSDEVAAVLTITWPPNSSPDSGTIVSGLPSLRGLEMPDSPTALVKGSPKAMAAMDALRNQVLAMTQLKLEWEAARDRLTRDHVTQWQRLCFHGATFRNKNQRLFVEQPPSPGTEGHWILSVESDPVRNINFSGVFENLPAGGVRIRVTGATALILGEVDRPSTEREASSFRGATLEIDPASDGVFFTLPGNAPILFPFDGAVDMLPPQTQSS